MNTERPLKMYVLVRRDLSETYRNVQGVHAVAQYSLDGDQELYRKWNNSTLVHLAVGNLGSIRRWADILEERGKKFVPFREPDLDGQITAIACVDTGDIFRKLPLA